jgi:hypothetical protein
MARHSRKHSRRNNRFKRTFRHGVKSTLPLVKSTLPLVKAVRTTSKKGFKKGFKTMKNTSKKYMPQVKTGLENVGSKVTKTATKSVPILQKASRDLFGMFGIKKKRRN